jgi:hypothetical protein
MEAYLDWQKSGGIKLNDVIEEFKYVYKGQEIKAGDFVNYINGIASKVDYGESVDTQLSTEAYTGQIISAVALDENRVFIAHKYTTNNYLYGIVCTINGASITYGEDTALRTLGKAGVRISAVLLDDGNVFIAHSEGDTYALNGMVVSINGTTITAGTDTVISSNAYTGRTISSVKLDGNRIFIAHNYNSTNQYLYGVVVTIEGTTITAGSDTALVSSSNAGFIISTCLLPNGDVFIAHSYDSSNYQLYGIVVSISGTTITKGSDTAIDTTNYAGRFISAVALDENRVFIAYSYTSSYYLHAIVCTISGTTISKGTTVGNGVVRTSHTAISAIKINEKNVLVTHTYGNNSAGAPLDHVLYGCIYTIDGTTITAGTDTLLNNNSHAGHIISSLLLDNGTIFAAHSNSSDYYLYAQIFGIDYENNVPTNQISITDYETQVTPATEPPFNAIALSSGVGGTDTEHNEQVKIAFMAGLKTVDGKFVIDKNGNLIVPKGGN